RRPRWINSEHLRCTGLAAMGEIGGVFWAGGAALALVIPLLFVNWFGDSLDGTVARVRHHARTRYGYYVGNGLDAVSFAARFGGLVLGRFMSPSLGLGFLSAYYLLIAEISMATHARGT